jgi:hypothetical protein
VSGHAVEICAFAALALPKQDASLRSRRQSSFWAVSVNAVVGQVINQALISIIKTHLRKNFRSVTLRMFPGKDSKKKFSSVNFFAGIAIASSTAIVMVMIFFMK